MSDSALLVSSKGITGEEFQDFALRLGGVPRGSGRYVVIEGDSNIWLALLRFDRVAEFYDEDTVSGWAEGLGEPPEIIVEIQLDHTDKSRELYLKIAVEFGRAWPVVLVDLEGRDVSYALACERYAVLRGNACQ
ncbi:hypothetical protein [Pseudomonas sp. NPDC089734]|uniref:hypothetical protein n=1 Tax=Pseudomonas sp. NPDC089734 TaxID=3364469 RepID=UPI0037F3B850